VLFDTGKAVRKVLDAWAYIMLAIVLLLAILSGYIEADITPEIGINIGVDYVLLLLYCYGARMCLDNAAKQRGMGSAAYQDAVTLLGKVRMTVKEACPQSLQTFCENYRAAELDTVRSQILADALLTEDDYNAYLQSGAPKSMPRRQRRALRRAHRQKPIALNRYMIGRPVASRVKRENLNTPASAVWSTSVRQMLISAIMVAFPVSIVVSLIVEPTFATLIAGLIKAFSIMLSGISGYQTRLRNMLECVPEYARKQDELMYQYAAWLVKRHE